MIFLNVIIITSLSFLFSANYSPPSDLNSYRFSYGLLLEDPDIYNPNKPLKTMSTRQIINAGYLYNKNVSSVVFIGAGSATGSGVVVSRNEIITNYHVVEGQEIVDVVLYSPQFSSIKEIVANEESIFSAKVIAVDKERDLAMIKTDKYLPKPVKFGENKFINIADDVFAIGHPATLWSFTYGVVSALPTPKTWTYDGNTELVANCIQTQTPINPGNSGGPLFNTKGQLIGINSYTTEGEGLNFAVRIDEINDFIDKAYKGEYPIGEKKKDIVWEIIENHGLEEFGVNEVWGSDQDGNGAHDAWLGYASKDAKSLIIRFFDFNGDGEFDVLHDVQTGEILFDYDYDGTPDEIGIDIDGDWAPDEYKKY